MPENKEKIKFSATGYSLKGSDTDTGYASSNKGYSRLGLSEARNYSQSPAVMYGPANLFPVPYSKVEEAVNDEKFRKYGRKCPVCGKDFTEGSSGSGSGTGSGIGLGYAYSFA